MNILDKTIPKCLECKTEWNDTPIVKSIGAISEPASYYEKYELCLFHFTLQIDTSLNRVPALPPHPLLVFVMKNSFKPLLFFLPQKSFNA